MYKKSKSEDRKEIADLMTFLVKRGRSDVIVRTSSDEGILTQLITEYISLAIAK